MQTFNQYYYGANLFNNDFDKEVSQIGTLSLIARQQAQGSILATHEGMMIKKMNLNSMYLMVGKCFRRWAGSNTLWTQQLLHC